MMLRCFWEPHKGARTQTVIRPSNMHEIMTVEHMNYLDIHHREREERWRYPDRLVGKTSQL